MKRSGEPAPLNADIAAALQARHDAIMIGLAPALEKIAREQLGRIYSDAALRSDVWGAEPVPAAANLPDWQRFSYSLALPDARDRAAVKRATIFDENLQERTLAPHMEAWARLLACSRQLQRAPRTPHLMAAMLHWRDLAKSTITPDSMLGAQMLRPKKHSLSKLYRAALAILESKGSDLSAKEVRRLLERDRVIAKSASYDVLRWKDDAGVTQTTSRTQFEKRLSQLRKKLA